MIPSIDPAQYNIPPDIRVLIAEDTEVSRKVLVLIFKKMGIEAEWVEDGQQAVEKLRASNYDLILMDVLMPVMNGIVATRTIRSEMNGKWPIIIGVGGDDGEDEVQACLASGMDAFIVKPPGLATLLGLIGSLFTKKTRPSSHIDFAHRNPIPCVCAVGTIA